MAKVWAARFLWIHNSPPPAPDSGSKGEAINATGGHLEPASPYTTHTGIMVEREGEVEADMEEKALFNC